MVKAQNKDPLQVSRKQCTVFRVGEEYFIEDGPTAVQEKPSGNGTTVNNANITGNGRTKLNEGDTIVFAGIANAIFRTGV